MRICVATNEQHPKGEMFRIVKTAEGKVVVDTTGKVRGRGAYLTKSKTAINAAMKKKCLDKHLETTVPTSIFEELLKLLGDMVD